MNTHAPHITQLGKFQNRTVTADGQTRASVTLGRLETLWFNTGTLCNIECVNCYIESSPTNDALSYISHAELVDYLDQIDTLGWRVEEIGFTGGEPFMNPDMIAMAETALSRGYRVLVLTNAMRPMMRKKVQAGLVRLIAKYGQALTFRVSLDHFTKTKNDQIRGKGSFEIALAGLHWLQAQGAGLAIAGRALWDETPDQSRKGYAALYAENDLAIDAENPAQTVLFPEMDETAEVPEITTSCWGILNKNPSDIMCASSRMIVKRRGAASPSVVACTLLPYAPEFDLGKTLQAAETTVFLNHRHCAKFCVLGGASCSA